MERKRVPVGIDDFKEIREKNCYFADKTMFINEVVENNFGATLILRPRRFGKTLNMSMLRYFFDIENREENRKLFDGLKIENTDKMEYQGKYPVIFLSFKDIKMKTWYDCKEKVYLTLAREARRHGFILENNLVGLEDFFLNLSEFLYAKYQKKTIILIDEYDTPLVSAHTEGYYEDAIYFFRNLLSAALKGNEYLEFGVMTGILRVAKESIFSGLNNLAVSTIMDNKYPHFGLTEDEVEELLQYYSLTYELPEVKEWYNGYRFGKQQVYNPWSIINFAANNKLKPYWINTSANDLIIKLLKKGEMENFKNLEHLFSGETIWTSISENMIFNNIDTLKNSLWSLMFFTGYLTYNSIKIGRIIKTESYELKIPNYEVFSFFQESFLSNYSTGERDLYSSMMENLLEGKIEKFSEEFKKLYLSTISYFDTDKEEKYFHNFMLGLLLFLRDEYTVSSNRESGYGRYDIALEPKDKNNYGFIFEFKVAADKKELEKKADEALQQIEKQEYDIAMRNNGITKIIKIGMAFAGKDVEIKAEIK
jgi:hypothetical protein